MFSDQDMPLVQSLEDALTYYAQVHASIFSQENRLLDDHEEFKLVSNLMNLLRPEINKSKLFESVRNSFCFSGISLNADAGTVAHWLFALARKRGASAAVNELAECFSRKVIDGELVVSLWGLLVEKQSGLAVSKKFRLSECEVLPNRQTIDCEDALRRGLPTAYIVVDAPSFPLISTAQEEPQKAFQSLQNRASLIRSVVIASTGVAPVQTGWWFRSKDAESAASIILDTSLVLMRAEIHNPRYEDPAPIDIVKAAKLLRLIEGAGSDESFVRRLERSMWRFESSRTRWGWPDQAIEMALAFEMLLGGGGGDSIARSVSTRAARICSKNLSDRQAIRFAVGALYHLRNASAHGGQGPRSKKYRGRDLSPTEVLNSAAKYYPITLEAILHLGPDPDWDAIDLS